MSGGRTGLATALIIGLSMFPSIGAAADFRSVAERVVVFYDAPSARATKLFVVSEAYPVEVVVTIDNWVKVRDISGELAWVEKKSLSERRTVLVRAPVAAVRQSAEDAALLVFRVREGVALDLTEVGASGWVKVRHRDGRSGYIRVAQVWGI